MINIIRLLQFIDCCLR